jgi:hypothetical protein
MTYGECETALRSALKGFQAGGAPAWGGPAALSDATIEVYILTLSGIQLTKDLDARFGRETVEVARQELGAWQLVLDYRTKAGRALAALPPVPAWTARAADFSWTIQSTPELLHDLAATGHPVLDITRDVCAEIGVLAAKRWSVSSGPSLRHRTSLSTASRVSAALSLLFDQAEKEVIAMSRGPRLPHLALVWEAIERRLLSRKFSYHRLVMMDELAEHGLAIVRRDILKAGVDLRVGDEQSVDATFYVFDGGVALRHGPDNGYISTYVREVNGLRQKQAAAWNKSVPALVVVENMQLRADRLRGRAKGLGADATFVFDRRVANGRFALPKASWSEERFRLAEERLEAEGLLRRTSDGYMLPDYRLAFGDVDGTLNISDACDRCWCSEVSCICAKAN